MAKKKATGKPPEPKKSPLRKNELRLFVFREFDPDHTGGLAVAIAKTPAEAKQLIAKQYKFVTDDTDWGEMSVHSLLQPIAFAVAGGG